MRPPNPRPGISRSPIRSLMAFSPSTACRRCSCPTPTTRRDQPVHLKVADMDLQKNSEFAVFSGPSTRYCPAGVYEWVDKDGDSLAGGRARATRAGRIVWGASDARLRDQRARTASTARPATSRTRTRTSTGCRRKAAKGRSIRTCEARPGPSRAADLECRRRAGLPEHVRRRPVSGRRTGMPAKGRSIRTCEASPARSLGRPSGKQGGALHLLARGLARHRKLHHDRARWSEPTSSRRSMR